MTNISKNFFEVKQGKKFILNLSCTCMVRLHIRDFEEDRTRQLLFARIHDSVNAIASICNRVTDKFSVSVNKGVSTANAKGVLNK